MFVKVKEEIEKNKHVKIMRNLKNIIYVEKNTRDIMIEIQLS